MSSPVSAAALYLEPRPSRLLLQLLLWSHLASALLLIVLAVGPLWPACFLPLVWFSYRFSHRRCMTPVRFARESDGRWLWYRTDGTVVPIRLLPDTLLTPRLVLFNVEEGGGRRHSVPLLADSLPTEQFRALRVALRLERVTADGAA